MTQKTETYASLWNEKNITLDQEFLDLAVRRAHRLRSEAFIANMTEIRRITRQAYQSSPFAKLVSEFRHLVEPTSKPSINA